MTSNELQQLSADRLPLLRQVDRADPQGMPMHLVAQPQRTFDSGIEQYPFCSGVRAPATLEVLHVGEELVEMRRMNGGAVVIVLERFLVVLRIDDDRLLGIRTLMSVRIRGRKVRPGQTVPRPTLLVNPPRLLLTAELFSAICYNNHFCSL